MEHLSSTELRDMRKFQIEIETRQVCINTVAPAPLPLFSLAGSELSFAGISKMPMAKLVYTFTPNKDSDSAMEGILRSNGVSQGLQPIDYQSGDGASPGLQSRDFSNGRGVHLPLHQSFQACDDRSLGEHSRDIPGGNDISQQYQYLMDLIGH
ncbi:hypothetical protein HAX54_035099 [Datura stramonium]|uniref:Uncharacterized protein n=1 Tax=Datura stramonium TaxID=4076 RepID=A0ABS8SEX5_DATST|nr:hypothetical protein [Datura stramonium]